MSLLSLYTRVDEEGIWRHSVLSDGPAPDTASPDDIVEVERVFLGDGTLDLSDPRVRDECFAGDLAKIRDAVGAERAEVVEGFDIAVLAYGYVYEWRTIVLCRLGAGRSALYEAMPREQMKQLREPGPVEVKAVCGALGKVGVTTWDGYYQDPWVMDGWSWTLILVKGDLQVTSSGSNAAPRGLDALKEHMFRLGDDGDSEKGSKRRKRRRKAW